MINRAERCVIYDVRQKGKAPKYRFFAGICAGHAVNNGMTVTAGWSAIA